MYSFSPLLIAATFLALVSTVVADLTITSPNATSFIVAGGQLPIAWTYTGPQPPTPPTISVELVDNSRTLFTGPLALFSNLATASGGATWNVPKLGYAGANFSIILVANVNSQATLYAQGPAFSIMPEGTAAPVSPSQPKGTTPSAASATRWEWAGKSTLVLVSSLLVWMQL
ncbi:hypothetical protein BGZ95_006173 [Linnemannia exigua]|uniref:Yeast cell wall synthesis Kre9/Knh1-like N-terminal domain-containing protein n=1 Tax=Linnemannia exigua TaxID=604196 RepID=A0AAD4D184_9FUNG|nr:hypothetical protein BGZ95_006173 [Linnemannia exigua]